MSSDLAHVGTDVASRARVGLARNDFLRIRELDRRILAGQSEAEAWAAIVTDPAIGIKPYRGADRIDVAAAARTLNSFYLRVAPTEAASSRAAVARHAAKFAPAAWARVESLVNGDFGEAKVRVGSEGEQRVSIDAAAAGVQLAAAKFALQTVGVGVKSEGATNAATFNGPTNVVFSFAAGQKARANGSGS